MPAHEQAPAWASYAPLAVLALVMLLRLRGMKRARPLRASALVAPPVIYALLVVAILWTMPPSAIGWGCFAGGLIVGGLVGWQRARLMRLHVDPASGAVMVRQSPAALILLVAIIGLRRLFMPAGGLLRDAGGTRIPAQALLATDALIAFALAMIVAQRIELWRRAAALRSSAPGLP